MVKMPETRLSARENGPYVITGDIRVFDHQGREFIRPQGTAIALCRCGHSQRKPFCDGSHKTVGFVSRDNAERSPLEVQS
jgi:CDGSH-type Zn-finger protein